MSSTVKRSKFAAPKKFRIPLEGGVDFWRGFARSARALGIKRTANRRAKTL